MFKTFCVILKLAAVTLAAAQGMTGGGVAAEFRGEWVPAKATCDSPIRLIIEPTAVVFAKGDDRAEYRKLDQCFSCAGRDVEGITWLTTDAQGDSPFTIYLDGSRKNRATVQIDFFNDKKLGTRFPLGKAALKKCK